MTEVLGYINAPHPLSWIFYGAIIRMNTSSSLHVRTTAIPIPILFYRTAVEKWPRFRLSRKIYRLIRCWHFAHNNYTMSCASEWRSAPYDINHSYYHYYYGMNLLLNSSCSFLELAALLASYRSWTTNLFILPTCSLPLCLASLILCSLQM
jgi:hypothetical protein